MDAPQSNIHHRMLEEVQDPTIAFYNRMVARLAVEEWVIDVDNGCTTNKMAHRRTANLIDNTQRVENFVVAECRSKGALNITSPILVKKYDYYYDEEYAIEK